MQGSTARDRHPLHQRAGQRDARRRGQRGRRRSGHRRGGRRHLDLRARHRAAPIPTGPWSRPARPADAGQLVRLGRAAGCCPLSASRWRSPAARRRAAAGRRRRRSSGCGRSAFDELDGWHEDDPREALRRVPALLRQARGARRAGRWAPTRRSASVGDWRRSAPPPAQPASRGSAAARARLLRDLVPALSGRRQRRSRGPVHRLLRAGAERLAAAPATRYPVPLHAPPPDLLRIDLGRFNPDLAGYAIYGRVAGRRVRALLLARRHRARRARRAAASSCSGSTTRSPSSSCRSRARARSGSTTARWSGSATPGRTASPTARSAAI